MILTVHDPLAEPMIHRDFPGGFEDLQEYVMEVCEGIKDHWSGIRKTRATRAGNTRTTSVCLPTIRRRCRRSTRLRTSAARWPIRLTRGGLRRLPGRSGRTTVAMIRPVCRASGAASSSSKANHG